MTPQVRSVTDVIFSAVDEYNEQATAGHKLEKAAGTILMGPDGVLDSLELVRLIISVEQAVAEEMGETITLADDKAMSQRNSPFLTIQTLADYIAQLLDAP